MTLAFKRGVNSFLDGSDLDREIILSKKIGYK